MQNIFIRLGYNFQRRSQVQSWMLHSSLAVVIIITDLRSVSGGKKSVMAIHTNHTYSSHTSYRSCSSVVAQRQCQEGRVNRRQNHLVCAFSFIRPSVHVTGEEKKGINNSNLLFLSRL